MLTTTLSADLRQERRTDRYAARHTLWRESALPRVRNCGRVHRGGSDSTGVGVKVSQGADGGRVAGYANLQHCGSVWACPVCQAVIAATRQREIEAGLTAWVATGGRVALGTFTIRHNRGHSLRSLWDALSAAWAAVTSGRGWEDDQLARGTLRLARNRKGQSVVKGWIPSVRVVEVTHGVNGWHVHVHAVMLLPADTTTDDVAHLEARMFGRWASQLQVAGFDCTRERGADLRLLDVDADLAADLGGYFVKARYAASESASFEVARGDLKQPAVGHRTPFGILADVVALGDADDLATWHEYERASKGRRAVTWSHGLRAHLALAVESSDQEVADEDQGGDVVAEVPSDVWREVTKGRADLALLRAFEVSDQEGWAFLAPYFDAADGDPLGFMRAARARRRGSSG